MIAIRLFSLRAQVCLILFVNLVLAVLQNVTVDDAVTVGLVVPGYLPSQSNWAQGNECTGCLAKPDPSFAYNGTWHDTTFHPGPGNATPAIQLTFTGSGLYIFFILANNLGVNVTSFTNVEFILDNVQVSTYTHNPTTSTDYDYNQTVYANNSIPYGEHTMTVAPVNDSINSVLILFDYLIYTTDADATTTTTSTGTSTPTSSGAITTSSGPNVGAIVGGTIGGVAVLASAIIFAICYYRRKRRAAGRPVSSQMDVIEPFVLPPQTPATSSQTSSLPIQRVLMGSPATLPGQKQTISISSASALPSNPPSTPTQSSQSNASRGRDNTEILEQVGMLRNEVARLRRLQDQGWSGSDAGSEMPPEYS